LHQHIYKTCQRYQHSTYQYMLVAVTWTTLKKLTVATQTWYLTGLAVVSSDHNHALWRKVSPLVLLASICCGQLRIKYGMYVFIHFKHIICVETDIVFDNTKYKIWGKILDWQWTFWQVCQKFNNTLYAGSHYPQVLYTLTQLYLKKWWCPVASPGFGVRGHDDRGAEGARIEAPKAPSRVPYGEGCPLPSQL